MSGEFDNYRPPSAIVNPDGSVEIWDSTARDYQKHYPGLKPTSPREWATGGDNELFDPATMSERPGNPIATAFDYDAPDDNAGPKFGNLFDHLGAEDNCIYCNTPLVKSPNHPTWKTCPNCEAGFMEKDLPQRPDRRGEPSRPGPVHQGGPSQGILNDDGEAENNYRHQPDTMRDVADVSCPRCGKPTVDSECPHCGYNKGDDTWRYQDRTPDPGVFNDNVPKRDMHQYDDMVPWGSGATSHYVRPSTEDEKSEMTDIYDPIARLTIGKDDSPNLNDCPECGNPMIKRASEGFEFCPDCGHRNKVVDTVISKKDDDDDGHWIEKAVKKPGQLHKDLGVPEGENIPEDKLEEAEHSDSKKIRERAQFAENVKKGSVEAGFLNELEHGVSDVGDLGKDFYNGHPLEVAGDVANIGADAAKGVAYGAKDHPLIAAGLAAPFLLPAAGVGLGAMAGVEGAEALGGLGGDAVLEGATSPAGASIARAMATRGLQSGSKFYQGLGSRIGIGGAQAGEGEAAAGGARIPQMAKSLMGKAAAPASMIGAQHMMGGGGMAATPGASTMTPGYSDMAYQSKTAGLELTPEEIVERRAWSKEYDLFTHLAADDDQSSDLSVQTDGDNVTDPATQGSQEETGDSLDELLKSLGDSGSANVDAYSPAQNAAIHHLNDNMPTILAFAGSDHSGKGHPIFEAVKQMLESAFGEKILDELGDDEHGTEHESVPPEHEKSEAPEHDEEKKAASVRVAAQLTQNPSPVPSPSHATPAAGMQPQTQQSAAPCAVCGGPHPTDQHPSAVTPPAQGGQFGTTMSKTTLLEAVAARKPKMCPFHGDLVDYSLTLGDPASARTAVRPSDYGVNYCKSGEFEGKCNFKPAMVTQEFWDTKAEQSQQRREQMQETPEVGFPGAEAPVEAAPVAEFGGETEEGYVPEKRHDVPAEQETAVGHGTVNNPDAALQMAAKLLHEAGVIPAGYHFDLSIQKTGSIHDLGVTEGGRYKMHSNKYDVADDVTVTKVKPNSITVVYHFPGGMDSAPQELTEDQLQADGIHTFEQVGGHVSEQPQVSEELDARGQGQPDTAPDVNEVTDLSQTHDGAHTDPVEAEFDGELEGGEEGDGMQMAAGFREVDGGFFVDQDDNPVDYATYAAMRRETADPSMQWLWDDVNKQNALSARQQEMQAVMAGRQFSYREQADFIQEPGTARNADKLDLSGTHYVEGSGYGTEEVPDEHLWLGL